MAKKRKVQKSLTSHIFWGAISGVTGLWVANQYWKALPQPIKDGYNERISTTTAPADTETFDYRVAAGVGAVYGLATYYIPALRFIRKLIFGSAIWTFRGTKLLAFLGGIEDRSTNSSHPIASIAKRAVSRKGLEALVQRAER